ncbi:GDP-L-fucose synthase [Candidatus Magnetomoraceae bacterium gMMP-15]
MNENSKIYIAGHKGMVGSAIYRRLDREGFNRIITCTHSDLDLTQQSDVMAFFKDKKPEYVFVAAARVGGIMANSIYPAKFIYQNLQIQNNIIHYAHVFGVKKLLFLGSSCIYPRDCAQPMKEEYLLTGPLEPTNEAYAIAKIAGIKMCQFYNQQYKVNFVSAMPTNLYGPQDNFDLETSHALPALIRKFHEGYKQQSESVVLWGTGSAKRDFLYVDDLADACFFIMKNIDADDLKAKKLSHINIGAGKDITIKELAEMIQNIVGYPGKITYDKSKPNGMPVKRLDISMLNDFGWQYKTSLKNGIIKTYKWYQNSASLL